MAARMISFRFSETEARELSLAARRRGVTISDLCRESLYRVYGIGELREVQRPSQADPPRVLRRGPRHPACSAGPADVRRWQRSLGSSDI